MTPHEPPAMPAGSRGWWRVLGSAGTVLSPFMAWPAFLLSLRHGAPVAHGWAVLWSIFFLLLAVPAAFAADGRGVGLVALQCAGGYVASRLFTAPPAALRAGLVAGVALMALGAVVEASIYQRAWMAPGEHPRAAADWSALWGVDRVEAPASYRTWDLPEGAGGLTLSFDVRRSGDEHAVAWRRSTADVGLGHVEEDGGAADRLVLPSEGDPWVARDYRVEGTVGALRTEFRARSDVQARGRVHLLVEGETVHSEVVEVSEAWKTFDVTWQPASASEVETATLQLNDFDGRTLFVREVDLQRRVPGGGWRSLGPPRQAYATVAIDFADRNSQLAQDRVAFLPGDAWRRVEATFDDAGLTERRASGELSAGRTILRLPQGAEVELRDVRLEDAMSGVAARPLSGLPRQELWYGHPNIMGHAAAVAGVALVAAAPLRVTTGLGLALALTVAWLSGGRAALVVLILAAPAVAWLRSGTASGVARRLRRLLGGVLVVVAAAGVLYVVVEGASRSAAGQPPRTAIVSAAVAVIRENPWTGIGHAPGAFEAAWRDAGDVPAEPVRHAHNWWLQLGVVHGVPGLLAAAWFSLGLLLIAWRQAGGPGVAFVGAVLALQAVDATLLHWAVLSPLVLTLNALGRRPVGVASDSAPRPGGV